jgi:hypothetical protein
MQWLTGHGVSRWFDLREQTLKLRVQVDALKQVVHIGKRRNLLALSYRRCWRGPGTPLGEDAGRRRAAGP